MAHTAAAIPRIESGDAAARVWQCRQSHTEDTRPATFRFPHILQKSDGLFILLDSRSDLRNISRVCGLHCYSSTHIAKLLGCPALLRQSFEVLLVPRLIPPELRQPEITVRSGDESGFTRMRVPETSMNEYHFASCGENQVRGSRKVSPVQPETIAEPVYEAPHCHFRFGVFTADCSHVLAAIHTSSILEFLAEPFQDSELLILACSSYLRQEPESGRLLCCNILRSLVAGRTKRPKVG